MRAAISTTPALLSLAVCSILLLTPAAAGAVTQDCKQLYDLYQTCFETGANSDSAQTCMSQSFRDMERTAVKLNAGPRKKKPGQAQALVELVCSTGCDDATSTQVRASQQEFTEAFCE